MRLGAGVASLALVCLVVTGCFDPEFPDGTIHCTIEKDCPPGFECGGDRFCHRLGGTPQIDGAVGGVAGSGGGVGGGAHDGGAGATEVGGRGGAGTSGTGVGGVTGAAGGSGAAGGAIGRGGTSGTAGGSTGAGGALGGAGGGRAGTGGSSGTGGGCATTCTPGDHRCDTGGLASCVMVGSCPTWSAAVGCSGRKTCQGNAPAASCLCPAAPTGCTAAGKACVSGSLVTCAVDADGCIYAATTATCPASDPCGGTFPNAACVCPTKPAACNGQTGTFCDQNGAVVVTCALDAGGCLGISKQVSCSVPCAGSAGSATCGTCPSAPAECQGHAGTVCLTDGRLETCGLDANGCLAATNVSPCPSDLTCQGSAPAAGCQCPAAPPAACMGQVGTACQSSTTQLTCSRTANGCLVAGTTTTCSAPKTCSGTAPSGACACPALPAECQAGQAGKYCDASGKLVTCAATNGCIQASTAPCATGLVCSGNFPNGGCGCPAPPASCPTTGTFCSGGGTLVSCTQNAQGCLQEADTSCSGMGLVCGTSGGSASCVCPAPPAGCSGGAGTKSCTADKTLLVCSSDSHGCVVSQSTACLSGQYCWTSTSACALPQAIGYPTDLGSSGNKTAGYLLGQAIALSAPSTIRSFGLLAPAAASMVSLGLYTDVGGLPKQLVAKAEFQAVVTTKNEYPASPATSGGSLQVPAGTYWIMAMFDTTTATEGAPASGPTTTVAFMAAGWGALPATLTGATTQAAQRATNYYLLITQ